MAGELPFYGTVTLTRDPELKFSQDGKARVHVAAAKNPRVKQADGSWGNDENANPFLQVTAFGQLAEHIAESLTKGDMALVIGRWKLRKWQKEDGTEGNTVDVVADEVGPSLRFATAKPVKAERQGGAQRSSGGQADPWAQHTPAGGFESAPPF